MVEIHPIPILGDNYVWALFDRDRGTAAIVDPGDAAPVKRWLVDTGLKLEALLITHHHGDHTAGCAELVADHAIPVFASARESVTEANNPVSEGDAVVLDRLGLRLEVLEVPGHTAGHVAYHGTDLLLSGDTLFSGGCGRVFEGTVEQMHRSLSRLASIEGETLVCCAHEYTVANLTFALEVDPTNRALASRLEAARNTRRQALPTLPSTIDLERATNPFLRCGEEDIRQAASHRIGRQLTSEVEVFAAIRSWKDSWRGPR